MLHKTPPLPRKQMSLFHTMPPMPRKLPMNASEADAHTEEYTIDTPEGPAAAVYGSAEAPGEAGEVIQAPANTAMLEHLSTQIIVAE